MNDGHFDDTGGAVAISVKDDRPITLWADNVYYAVPDRVLLCRSSLTCESGSLTVVLGPSGVGKTTLLNLLTGRIRAKEGAVGVNDEQMNSTISKYLINYVMAHDRMNEYLTVEETLVHTCRLKMPHKSLEFCQQESLVLMEQLSILHCRNTLVGGTWRKGISKGELKRLAVATELVGNPNCLILDEPTTGLDSSISYELIKILKRIAVERNLVVLCTLHQPNQRIFEMVDSLILMCGSPGRILFQGPPHRALPYLLGGARSLPDDGSSVPDRILDIISGTTSSEPSQPKRDDSKLSQSDCFFGHCSSFCSSSCRPNPTGFVSSVQDLVPQQQIVEGNYGPLKGLSEVQIITDAQSWGTQFLVCLKSHFTTNRRNPLMIVIIMLVNIVQALLLGFLFFQLNSDMTDINEPSFLTWSVFETPALRYFTYGLANDSPAMHNVTAVETPDLVDPLTSLFHGGPRLGNGKSSMIYDLVGNPDIVEWITDFTKCMRTHFFVDGSGYPKWDWSKSVIRDPSTAQAFSMPPWLEAANGPVCWNDKNVYDEVSFGKMSIPDGVTTIVSAMQMLDMALNIPKPWTVPEYKGDLIAWLSFQSSISDLADAVLCCGGSSMGFVTASIFPPTCASTSKYKGYQLPVFPGRMTWSEESKLALRQLLGTFHEVVVRERLATSPPTAPVAAVANKDPMSPSAPRRQLGSGVGGMVTDLINLLVKNPNSEVYKITLALKAMWAKLQDKENCRTRYCEILSSWGDEATKTIMNLVTSLLTVLNICSVIFFLVANLGFGSYDILLQFPQLRAVFNRERADGMYRVSPFLLSKMVADFPFQVLPGLVWAGIYWYMTGMRTDANTMAKYFAVAALIAFTAYSLGYFVSSLVLRLETSVILSPLILVCMFVLAGFFLRDSEMPHWIAWARYISIYRWAYFAVQLIQFPPGGSYGPIPNDLVLVLGGVTDNNMWRVCGYLVLISVVCRLGSYVCLRCLYTKVGLQA